MVPIETFQRLARARANRCRHLPSFNHLVESVYSMEGRRAEVFFNGNGACGASELSSISSSEMGTAMAFLRVVGSVKVPNFSSYYLKHAAETWGKKNGLSAYVSNGALIAAAVALDYPIRLSIDGGPNGYIGVMKAKLSALERRIGPFI